jgi:hypothetical protein
MRIAMMMTRSGEIPPQSRKMRQIQGGCHTKVTPHELFPGSEVFSLRFADWPARAAFEWCFDRWRPQGNPDLIEGAGAQQAERARFAPERAEGQLR